MLRLETFVRQLMVYQQQVTHYFAVLACLTRSIAASGRGGFDLLFVSEIPR